MVTQQCGVLSTSLKQAPVLVHSDAAKKCGTYVLKYLTMHHKCLSLEGFIQHLNSLILLITHQSRKGEREHRDFRTISAKGLNQSLLKQKGIFALALLC